MRFVLVGTSHPGNIGAAARAMKTMMQEQLVLVSPRTTLDSEAISRSSGAEDVLRSAREYPTLEEAVADSHWVVGCSARPRRLSKQVLSPREFAEMALQKQASGQQVSIVFGREDRGLDNEELQRCDAHLVIPANPDYASLNLGAAVQVVAWELMENSSKAAIETEPSDAVALASHKEVEGLYQHYWNAMVRSGFLDPERPKQIMARLRRLYSRAGLEKVEVNILRGILTELEKKGR